MFPCQGLDTWTQALAQTHRSIHSTMRFFKVFGSASKASDKKWQAQVIQKRAQLCAPRDLLLWTPHMSARGIRRSERVDSIIELAALEALAVNPGLQAASSLSFAEKKRLLRNIYVDISQNPGYASSTNQKGESGCLATSTTLYSFGQDRIVVPFELLLLQGHRRGLVVPPELKSAALRNLAGEAMFLPCLASVVWCAYLLRGLP